ncbi:MAG: YicC family protein [Arenicella sp.]|nr:YicC family protein [Arenicella sp.]
MTNSMTAYAQAATETEIGELSCEIRGVNHRYLDIAPRMPEELRVYEGELRDAISARLTRGRIDCFVRLKESDSGSLVPNAELAGDLQELLTEMHALVPDMQPLRAIDVLHWPGMLQAKQIEPAVIKASLMQVLNSALDDLLSARAQEGAKLSGLIDERLTKMSGIIADIETFLPELETNYRARLDEKLAEIRDQLDAARLEQEMVIFLHKTDVAEELDRLRVHIEEVSAVLDKNEPSGRRLDFLMQELNREANTLGSKSQDPRLTRASVDMKVLIEQMREQVQNIE